MTLGVNVANGNLLLESRDLAIHGTGLDLVVDRSYNSLSADASSIGGHGWRLSSDTRLSVNGDGSIAYVGPSGEQLSFALAPDGTYVSPGGLHATLRRLDAAHYELSDNATGQVATFGASGVGGSLVLTGQRDRYANMIAFGYSGPGKLGSITDTQGRVVNVTATAAGAISRFTDWTGRTVQYLYDAAGRLASTTDGAGGSTQYGFDGSGRLVSIRTAAGRRALIGYDAQGRVASVMRLVVSTDTTGPTTRFSYGTGTPCVANDVKTIVSDPDAATSSGHTVTYCSDTLGRVTSTTDAGGNTTATGYSPAGDVLWMRFPAGGVDNFARDALGNLVCVQRGATSVTLCAGGGGLKTTIAYGNSDALTRYFPTRVTNPQGHSQRFCYNGATPGCGTSSGPPGSLQSVTNDLLTQNIRRYAYSARGVLSARSDARGYTENYLLDSGGNLAAIMPPAGAALGNWTVGHDALGRAQTITDGAGGTATYTYDALDRQTKVVYAPGGRTVSYVYDPDGFLQTLTDPSGTKTSTYDGLGRVTREEFPAPIFGVASNAYTYDAASNLASITDGGGTTTYVYDALNQLASMRVPGDSQSTVFAYDREGNRTQIRYASGVTVNWSYDLPTGRTLSVINKSSTGSVISSFVYTYTLGSSDTELPQMVSGSVYTYDALDRLTNVGTGANGAHYALDGDGNITSKTEFGTTRTYAFGPFNLPTDLRFQHNANGDDTADGDHGYQYNTARQLTLIQRRDVSSTLTYRGDSHTELIQDGTLGIQSNVLGISVRGSRYYARADDGTLIGERDGPGRDINYLYDGQGSVAGLTSGIRYQYAPMGHVFNDQSLGDPNPFGYHGEYQAGAENAGIICDGIYVTPAGLYNDHDARYVQTSGIQAAETTIPIVRSIAKPPTGPGSVPPAQRDPKRLFTRPEVEEGLREQGGHCVICNDPIDDAGDARGHHVKRHADGGRTVEDNLAVLCPECHVNIHRR
ncbi:MAG TPA: DUF6531 domain-containing protein [Solirubrobacteraceae bacterium]|nr:DUF6531 domain-containing protein [Solirubrobacteraceae bacterium]